MSVDEPALRWPGEDLDRAFGAGVPGYIFYLILQVGRRREVALAKGLQALDLSVPKWRALVVIGRLGKCTMNELARLSAVDRTTLTRTVDQLVEAGWVRRQASAADRRRVLLDLTDSGWAMADAARAVNRDLNEAFLSGVPEPMQRTALRVLQSVTDALIADEATALSVLTFDHAEGVEV